MSNYIKIKHVGNVRKQDYVNAKTKDLIAFGYSNLTRQDVHEQVEKILKGDKDLSVIGELCKSDIEI